MANRILNYGVFGVFIALLLAPGASLLLGFRAQPFEGRTIPEFPVPSLQRIVDPSFYASFDEALIAQNPLREISVKVNARLNYRLFGDVDSREVFSGTNGWLFYYETIYGDCQSAGELNAQFDNLSKLTETLRRHDKPYIFTITPDKVAIFPENLTEIGRETGACRAKNRALLQDAVRALDISYFDSWLAMRALRESDTVPVYVKDETHWTQYGAAEFIRFIVQTFEPSLRTDQIEEIGQETILPDLGRMSGLYLPRSMPTVRFVREGNQLRASESIDHGGPGRPYVLNTSNTTGAPLSEKRVFVLHDSFMYVGWDQLSQYFSNAIFMHWTAVTPERFAEFAQASDVIVIQSVERETVNRLATHFSDEAFLIALEKQLSDEENAGLSFWPD